jgi:hypothetical protein
MLQLARVGWRKFSALKLSMRLLPRPRLVDPRRGSFVRSHRAAAAKLVHVLVPEMPWTNFLAGPESPGMPRRAPWCGNKESPGCSGPPRQRCLGVFYPAGLLPSRRHRPRTKQKSPVRDCTRPFAPLWSPECSPFQAVLIASVVCNANATAALVIQARSPSGRQCAIALQPLGKPLRHRRHAGAGESA